MTLAPLLLAALLQGPTPAEGPAAFQVVCHPSVTGTKVSRETLAGIFLKKTLRWGDGTPIEPVERSLTLPLRADFSRRVLGFSVAEVQIYWGKAMREGVRPPTVKGSDEEVLAYVSQKAGAIGYVAAGLELPPGVKALEIQ
jgi:ABC-type phosphate transport system substrate-binding protein